MKHRVRSIVAFFHLAATMPVRKTNSAHPPEPTSHGAPTPSALDSYDGKDTGYMGYGPSYSAQLDNKSPDVESIPLAEYVDRDIVERRTSESKSAGRSGFVGWMESWTGLEGPFIWLLFNGIVSFCWGIALAIFAAGLVPITWALSNFARVHDSDADWTNEIVALVGSFATMHVTYVLQLALELYSHIILAGEFTLKDLKWMQGVNEVTLFAEFPDRPGGPPRVENPHGIGQRIRGWWGAFYRWADNRRLAWIVIYLGLALHATSVVSILQPGGFTSQQSCGCFSPHLHLIRAEEYWQHVVFNDPIPCGVAPDRVSFDTLFDGTTQIVLDKLSLDVGIQLGSYVGKHSVLHLPPYF